MRTVLEKRCRENQNTYFMSSNFLFSKVAAVYEIRSKIMMETEGPQMTSKHGAYALRAGLARLHARPRMDTPTRPGTHMHVRARTRRNM